MNSDKAYRAGFEARCREFGVDPSEVIKAAQYVGGLGGAAIGGAIGALRRPADKREPVRARLINMLKGMLVGGGVGALGEIGLNRYVGNRNANLEASRQRVTSKMNKMPLEDPTRATLAKSYNQAKTRNANSSLTQLIGLLDRGSARIKSPFTPKAEPKATPKAKT